MKLRFNLPEGWEVSSWEGEEWFEEIGDGVSFEEFHITPATNDILSGIEVSVMTYGGWAGAYEIAEREAEDYLDSLNLPDSLRPDTIKFIKECEIGGEKAYYFVKQKPNESAADIRIFLDAPCAFIDAYIPNWDYGFGEGQALEFLSTFISFE